MYDFSIIVDYQLGPYEYQVKYLDETCYAILRDGESIHGTCSAEDVMRHMAGVIEGLTYKIRLNDDPEEIY